jgi:hypothetical protein
MVWWAAILVTFGLSVIGLYAPDPTMLLIIIGSTIWAAIDSSRIDLIKYKSGISYRPVVLFIGILGIWIIAFPWYLIVRGKILSGTAVLKDKFR